jgi:hypothetical protein
MNTQLYVNVAFCALRSRSVVWPPCGVSCLLIARLPFFTTGTVSSLPGIDSLCCLHCVCVQDSGVFCLGIETSSVVRGVIDDFVDCKPKQYRL